MKRLLVDTCVWYALLDQQDDASIYAEKIENALKTHQLIVPYPVLYETLNTRFSHNQYGQCERIFRFLNDPNKCVKIPDDSYREKAMAIFEQNTTQTQKYALVDIIIRLMMEDVNLGPMIVYSFNVRDFIDKFNGIVEVVSPKDTTDI